MPVHMPTVIAAAAVVALFLLLAPAPEGCGCKGRKAALDRLAVRIFG